MLPASKFPFLSSKRICFLEPNSSYMPARMKMQAKLYVKMVTFTSLSRIQCWAINLLIRFAIATMVRIGGLPNDSGISVASAT